MILTNEEKAVRFDRLVAQANKAKRAYYNRNKEKLCEQRRNNYQRNIIEERQRARDYSDCTKVKKRAYYMANRDKILADRRMKRQGNTSEA